MSVSSSNEMFINMKDVPFYDGKFHYFEQNKSTLEFYEEEWKKINNGITIGGVFIHPWLYYHLNYFKTPIPQSDKTEKIMNPPLRDNEWYFMENYMDAEANDKVLMIFGSRRYSKSSIIASVLSWLATIKENGKSEVIGGSDDDLIQLTSLIETGMINMHPAFKLTNNTNDWNKHIKFGVKHKSNEAIPYSEIRIKNAADGIEKKSEKGAGGSPVGWILDEALEENTLVYLKDKTIPIKDINVGDEIYGDDGKLTKVLEKHAFKDRQLYKITFSDGREIECCENHLWEVQSNNSSKKTKVLSTKDLINSYKTYQIDPRYNNKKTIKAKFNINLNKPIEYPEKSFYIDPYILGLYIGDGFCNTTAIGSDDEFIIDAIKNYTKSIGLKYTIDERITKSNNFKEIRISKVKGRTNPLRDELRRLNTFEEKEIPEEYLFSSVEQRLELLRGLLDSDGYCSKNVIEFSSSYPKIQNSFEKLCRSLGIRLKISEKISSYRKEGKKIECKISKRYSLSTDFKVFKLPRKAILQNPSVNKKAIFYKTKINIQDISPTSKSNAYCIKVDNKSKLFIAGNYIVTHNCGKFEFIKFLLSALPAFKTVHGMKLIPILTGTSGNAELAKDAETVLSNPEMYEVLPMDWDRLENRIPDVADITWKRTKFGMFVPAQMTGADGLIKIETNLASYLNIDNEDLKKIKLQNTDWKNANKVLKTAIDLVKKDITLLHKRQMYYPQDPEWCFLGNVDNPFPVVPAAKHRKKLIEEGKIGKDVEVSQKQGTILDYELSDKVRAPFPFKGGGIVDAPIVIFEDPPSQKPEYGEYVAGLDPYKQAQSGTDSVGSLYGLKRKTDIATPIEQIVYAYSARPKTMTIFNRTCEQLIEGWNSECLMENADQSFLQYLDAKNKAEMLLADGVDWSKTVNPNSNPSTKLGYYPTEKNVNYLLSLTISYAWEKVVVGYEEDGVTPIEKLGVEFIPCIDLLEEMINYKPGENHDRLRAFGSALAWARHLDKMNVMPRVKKHDDATMLRERERARALNKGFGLVKAKEVDF